MIVVKCTSYTAAHINQAEKSSHAEILLYTQSDNTEQIVTIIRSVTFSVRNVLYPKAIFSGKEQHSTYELVFSVL